GVCRLAEAAVAWAAAVVSRPPAHGPRPVPGSRPRRRPGPALRRFVNEKCSWRCSLEGYAQPAARAMAALSVPAGSHCQASPDRMSGCSYLRRRVHVLHLYRAAPLQELPGIVLEHKTVAHFPEPDRPLRHMRRTGAFGG